MSGVGFFELVILFLIGLIVLGPKRLHSVATQLGSWVGQARRMTRAMKRQLEEELDLGDDLKAVKNIASDIKGNREVVTSDTGLLCSPKDAQCYANALHGLIRDVPTRQSLGRAALARANDLFSLKRLHQQVAEVYEDLLETD